MKDEEYFALDCISQSDINLFIKNKTEYALAREQGRGESTKAMDLGSLNHCLLFEPKEFHNRYAIYNGITPVSAQAKKFYNLVWEQEIPMNATDAYVNSYSCKSKSAAAISKEANELQMQLMEYYEFMRDHGHKNMITEELELQSRRMIHQVYLHPGVQKTLLAGRINPNFIIEKELGIIWKHYASAGRELKSKVDELHIDIENAIVYAYDYKTTRTPNAKSFRSSVKYYGYDIQESFYATAIQIYLKEKYGKHFKVIFRFIPQRNEKSFNVLGVIQFSDHDRGVAYDKWVAALREMIDCIETGQFENEEAYSEEGVTYMTLDDTPVLILEEGGDY